MGCRLFKAGRLGLNPVLATIILIAVAIAAATFTYHTFFSQAETISHSPSVSITSVSILKAESYASLHLTVKNDGGQTLYFGAYVDAARDGLQALGDATVPCCPEAKGLIIYAAVRLPPGTYTFTWGADDRANVFVRGLGLSGWTPVGSWVWGPASGGITVQGGVYEIAYVCTDFCWHGWADFRANLPVSQIRWLVTAYHARWPVGACWSQPWVNQLNEFFSSVQADPIHPGSWHPGTYHVTGQYVCTTSGSFDFNTSWTDGNAHNESPTNQPIAPGSGCAGIPLGLLEPGESGGFIVFLDSGYATPVLRLETPTP